MMFSPPYLAGIFVFFNAKKTGRGTGLSQEKVFRFLWGVAKTI